MKQYRLFRSADGGALLQHPDCPDAIADGNDISEALRIMRLIETAKGLEHLADQLIPKLLENE